MPYLIDGHNLIPRLPGLSLEDSDDEMQLVEMLQEYCRRVAKQAEVFFDNAPPGGRRVRSFGRVKARFVPQGASADAAIMARLARLGREARNWTVVSSDRQVIAAARARQAASLSSEDFAARLVQTLSEAPQSAGAEMGMELSEDEIGEWLELFGGEER